MQIMSYDSYCLTNCKSVAADAKAADTAAKKAFESAAIVDYDAAPSPTHWDWENLRLVRGFDGGPEEYTFIAVHFEIESNTPALIRAYDEILSGLEADTFTKVVGGLANLKTVSSASFVRWASYVSACIHLSPLTWIAGIGAHYCFTAQDVQCF